MRYFTVEQANRTLPLVRKIVDDIVASYERWQDAVRGFELASAGARADLPDPRAELLQIEAQRLAAEIAGFVRELEALGVQFKGYDLGLVDFPSLLDERTIYLCWQRGEPDVRFWHEIDGGFAGRHPIEPAQLGSNRLTPSSSLDA